VFGLDLIDAKMNNIRKQELHMLPNSIFCENKINAEEDNKEHLDFMLCRPVTFFCLVPVAVLTAFYQNILGLI